MNRAQQLILRAYDEWAKTANLPPLLTADPPTGENELKARLADLLDIKSKNASDERVAHFADARIDQVRHKLSEHEAARAKRDSWWSSARGWVAIGISLLSLL